MSKENAQKFLKNKPESPFRGMEGDLQVYADGSQYFYGDDGSTGVRYSDGSSYFDDEGGHGNKYADGDSFYSNDDGSYGNGYADGTVYFHEEGEDENEYDDDSSSDNDVKLGIGGKLLVGTGIAVAGTAMLVSNLLSSGTSNNKESPIQDTSPATYNNREGSWKSTLIKAIALVVVVGIFVGAYLIHERTKSINVTIDIDEVIGKPYEIVEEMFINAGFSNISICESQDLSLEDEHLAGTVALVTIDGVKVFHPYDQFPRDAKIVIFYHVLKLISAPVSAKEAKGKNYETILQQFKNVGFVNIKVEAKYDLVLGWFSQEGEIAEIVINGDDKFKTDVFYRPDVEIIIVYHDYKKNAE